LLERVVCLYTLCLTGKATWLVWQSYCLLLDCSRNWTTLRIVKVVQNNHLVNLSKERKRFNKQNAR
jgi:hypothetical protein